MSDRRLLQGRLKSFASILGSGLTVNISTFIVLALAPIALPAQDFAILTLVVSGAMFGATLLDLGLSTAMIRQFSATKDKRVIGTTLRIRFGISAASATAASIAFFVLDLAPFAVAALCAGFLNIWTGLRMVDLAREDHSAFARANFAMSAMRMVCGPLALLSGSWFWIATALFLWPVLMIGAMRAPGLARDIAASDRTILGGLLNYSAPVYISALTFGACTYLPQAIAAARLDHIAVGSLGVTSTLVAPLGLINNALRAMVLPRISAGGRLSDEFGLRFDARSALGAAAALIILGGVVISAKFIYGNRFPDIGIVAGSILASYVIVIPFGLINMAVHRIGQPSLEAAVNTARLLVTAPVLWLAASSVVTLAVAAAALLVIGEIALFLVIRRATAAAKG